MPVSDVHMDPAGHVVQRAALPEEKVPDAHGITVAVVVSGQNEPAGQAVQEDCPPTAYVPAAQGDGTAALAEQEKPAGHSEQKAEPAGL